MRRLTLLFPFLLLTLFLRAQTYQPMALEGAHWIMYTVAGTPMHHSLVVRGDTVIDNQSYKKLYFQDLVNTWPLEPPFLVQDEYVLAVLRDDPVERKVYARVFADYPFGFDCGLDAELLLWDFSLMVGDTAVSCLTPEDQPWTVDSIYTSFQYGANRRTFRHLGGIQPAELVEGVGSTGGPLGLPPYMAVTNGEDQFYLWAYCVGTDADCDLVSRNRLLVQPQPLPVFPNPVSSILYAELPQGGQFTQWQLMNVHSQVVLNGNIRRSLLEVDVASLEAGVYFLWVSGKEGGIFGARVVKK
jgi:hypothetical protein